MKFKKKEERRESQLRHYSLNDRTKIFENEL